MSATSPRRRRCWSCRRGRGWGWRRGTPTWKGGCLMATPDGGPVAWRVRVRGLVQGVGFRPFVYRLARRLGLAGWVYNDAEGVLVHAEGDRAGLRRFVRLLRAEAPPAALVCSIGRGEVEPEGGGRFAIREN